MRSARSSSIGSHPDLHSRSPGGGNLPLSMILSENRFPLFEIMLYLPNVPLPKALVPQALVPQALVPQVLFTEFPNEPNGALLAGAAACCFARASAARAFLAAALRSRAMR